MTQTYIDEDKGLTLFALCIYGAVIFPKAEGYVDEKKAQWMTLKTVIYRCGDFHSVPLLGPWGDCQGKKYQTVCAWKFVRKIKDKGHYEGVTSGYEAWQANRRKNIIDISREVVERGKETSFEQPNQWIEKSIELEEKTRLLKQENEKLRKETSQWMDHATYLQNELKKTKSFLKNQDKLEKNLETLDKEMR
ncbi:girdin-like [Cucumis melo var. makuwa]|uniref:Girdin-like n=1 Tax=Cucumis melo var. makuwa TaxID=1194695 RepID=A0A5A7TPF1_CUCMM|nr:girdin-like [Cucumis melo var. makuwa]